MRRGGEGRGGEGRGEEGRGAGIVESKKILRIWPGAYRLNFCMLHTKKLFNRLSQLFAYCFGITADHTNLGHIGYVCMVNCGS
jgi:hypothetical protein